MKSNNYSFLENIPLDFVTANLEISQLEQGILKTSINTFNLNNIVIRRIISNLGYELQGAIQDYYIITLYNGMGDIIFNSSMIKKYFLVAGLGNQEFNEISIRGMEQYLILIKKEFFEKYFQLKEIKCFQLDKNSFYRLYYFLNFLSFQKSATFEEKNFYELILINFLENVFTGNEYQNNKQNYYKKFYEISKYIKQKYLLYDISIDELIAEFNISAKTLRKIFATTIGMPPKKYIKILKLNHLRRNLFDSKYSTISELMRSSNMQYQSQVIKDFKSIFYLTPKAYKNFLKN